MNENNFMGCLFGQAVGDALGLGSEFMSKEDVLKCYPNGLTNYDQIVQDAHRCRWKKGAWTDDTDMMLCILDALIQEKGEVRLKTIASNFKSWFNGTPMGIGRHTYNVLCLGDYVEDPLQAAEIIWTLEGKKSAANGGVMRTSVVGLLPGNTSEHAENICKLTHTDSRCVGSSVIVSQIIHELVYNDKSLNLDETISIANKYDERIVPFLKLASDVSSVDELELCGSEQGYTLKTLSAAIWAFWHSTTFEEGLIDVVNAGGDADTNAAVACAILGAKYGFRAIPPKYIDGMHNRNELELKFSKLYAILS